MKLLNSKSKLTHLYYIIIIFIHIYYFINGVSRVDLFVAVKYDVFSPNTEDDILPN